MTILLISTHGSNKAYGKSEYKVDSSNEEGLVTRSQHVRKARAVAGDGSTGDSNVAGEEAGIGAGAAVGGLAMGGMAIFALMKKRKKDEERAKLKKAEEQATEYESMSVISPEMSALHSIKPTAEGPATKPAPQKSGAQLMPSPYSPSPQVHTVETGPSSGDDDIPMSVLSARPEHVQAHGGKPSEEQKKISQGTISSGDISSYMDSPLASEVPNPSPPPKLVSPSKSATLGVVKSELKVHSAKKSAGLSPSLERLHHIDKEEVSVQNVGGVVPINSPNVSEESDAGVSAISAYEPH